MHGVAPMPGSKQITQAVATSAIKDAAQYTAEVELVYNVGFAMALGLWDEMKGTVKSGCSVSSTAADAHHHRRAGVMISYEANVHPTWAEAAATKAKSLQAAPGRLQTALSTAASTLNLAHVPTTGTLTVHTPAIATTEAADSSGLGVLTIVLIAAGGAVMCMLCCLAAYKLFRLDSTKNDIATTTELETKPSDSNDTTVTTGDRRCC